MIEYDADIVIVGSGVAGALSAYELARKGLRVLVLEAGPRISRSKVVDGFANTHKFDLSSGYPNTSMAPRPDWGTQNGNGYINFTGTEIPRLEYLRVVGGTTWHWSAACIRFLPSDFKMKTLYNIAEDWPISYDDLEPYYSRAEKEMGISGNGKTYQISPRSEKYPMPPLPASYMSKVISDKLAKRSEYEFVPLSIARNSRDYKGRVRCQGFGTCSPVCPSGAQYSAITHVEMAEKEGARVMDNMLVDKVMKDNDGKVTGVQGRQADGQIFKAKGEIVILAANGVETPKILLMSKDESMPNGLANSTGLVGKNYMDHPSVIFKFLMPEKIYPGRGPINSLASFVYRDGKFRQHRSGYTVSIHNQIRHHEIANDLISKGFLPPQLDDAIRDRALRQVEMSIAFEQLPNDNNGIKLNWSQKDSSGQPQMNMNVHYGTYEKKSFDYAEQELAKIVHLLDGEIVSSQRIYSQHHLMGMTCMGKNPKTSVTDGFGKTHEHDNLYILSSSLFPSGGTVNPTLTIAALSLRAAEKIYKELSKKIKVQITRE